MPSHSMASSLAEEQAATGRAGTHLRRAWHRNSSSKISRYSGRALDDGKVVWKAEVAVSSC